MNIDTSRYYIIPKTGAISELLPPDRTEMIVYASLFTESLADENYDGLTNEDGHKLFITLDTGQISKDTYLAEEQVNADIEALRKLGYIRVIKQPNGRNPVVFIEKLTNKRTANFAVKNDSVTSAKETPGESETIAITKKQQEQEIPAPEYTDAEISIFDCWQEAFGSQPDETVRKGISSYLTVMTLEVIMAAIYDSGSGPENILAKLQSYSDAGIATVDDLQQGDTKPPISEHRPGQDPGQKETPAAPANRIQVLCRACNDEFSKTDVNELWVSMQDIIDEEKWDDYTYLHEWLKQRYEEMDSRVKGGDRFVRQSMLQKIITES